MQLIRTVKNFCTWPLSYWRTKKPEIIIALSEFSTRSKCLSIQSSRISLEPMSSVCAT